MSWRRSIENRRHIQEPALTAKMDIRAALPWLTIFFILLAGGPGFAKPIKPRVIMELSVKKAGLDCKSGSEIAAAKSFCDSAEVKFKNRDLRGAIQDYTMATTSDARFVYAYIRLARVQEEEGEFGNAALTLTNALQIRCGPDILIKRASAYFQAQELDKALADVENAINYKDFPHEAYLYRGLIYWYKRYFTEALDSLNHFIRINPNDPKGYNYRADVYLDQGKLNDAIFDFNKAAKIAPDNADTFNQRGYAWLLKGDANKALSDFNKAIDMEQNGNFYVNRSLLWKQKGDLNQVISDCTIAISMSPNNFLAHIHRGDAYRLTGATKLAINDLNRAIQLNPRSPLARTFRGDLLLSLGHIDQAISDYDQALERVPDFIPAYTGRGLAHEAKHAFVLAREDFAKAISLPAATDAALAGPARKIALDRFSSMSAADAIAADEAEAKARASGRDNVARADVKALIPNAPSSQISSNDPASSKTTGPLPPLPPTDPIRHAAYDMLDRHCSRCHQTGRLSGASKPAKGFGNVLDLDSLEKNSSLIKPGDPDKSQLYFLIANGKMPYDVGQDGDFSQPIPTDVEVAAVRAWILNLGGQSARRDVMLATPKVTP